ncbi:9404_t:CDS:2, partial [Ambispora leptoticha]
MIKSVLKQQVRLVSAFSNRIWSIRATGVVVKRACSHPQHQLHTRPQLVPAMVLPQVFKRNLFDRRRPGDWTCNECGTLNFANRTECFGCKAIPKEREVAPGDWLCPNCSFYNYSSRGTCFKCNTLAPPESERGYAPERR